MTRTKVPEKHRDRDPEELAGRIHKFLESKDFAGIEVSIKNVVEFQSLDGETTRIAGPFVEIEAEGDVDPFEAIENEFEWDPEAIDDEERLARFLENPELTGEQEMRRVLAILVRRELEAPS